MGLMGFSMVCLTDFNVFLMAFTGFQWLFQWCVMMFKGFLMVVGRICFGFWFVC